MERWFDRVRFAGRWFARARSVPVPVTVAVSDASPVAHGAWQTWKRGTFGRWSRCRDHL